MDNNLFNTTFTTLVSSIRTPVIRIIFEVIVWDDFDESKIDIIKNYDMYTNDN